VFNDDSDYLVYLRVLKEACNEHDLDIWAYALMTNHIHLIAVPRYEFSISKALQNAHTRYTQYFNSKYLCVGHMWQGRPGIFVMDDEYMKNAIRYVERNPVRAGIVKRAEDYVWSSAAAHCDLRDDLLLSGDCPLTVEINNWREWLQLDNGEEEKKTFRLHTSTGMPLGNSEFIRQLEKLTGRTFRPQKVGRPKKENQGQTGCLPFPEEEKIRKQPV